MTTKPNGRCQRGQSEIGKAATFGLKMVGRVEMSISQNPQNL
jgi:hypothetical protein